MIDRPSGFSLSYIISRNACMWLDKLDLSTCGPVELWCSEYEGCMNISCASIIPHRGSYIV